MTNIGSNSVRREAQGSGAANAGAGSSGTFIVKIMQRYAADLQRSRLLLQSVLDALPAQIVVLDTRGVIIASNAAWRGDADRCGVTGRPDAVGVNYLQACEAAEGSEEASAVAAGAREVIAGRCAMFELEYPCHGANQQRWFIVRITRIAVDGANYAVVAHEDIGSRKLAELRTQQLNAELEERVAERTARLQAANAELERFSYSVSHDLRAPLRAIDNFSAFLLEDHAAQLDSEGRRRLGIIRSNATRMGQLIQNVLDFARAGQQPIERARIDMNALAREVVEELAPDLQQRQITLDIGDLPPAWGDRALLHQALINLLDNAVKFSAGSERPTIAVAGQAEDGMLVYLVRDNGVGFDPCCADKLFGVFQRLHGTAEFKGTGVGLAIVKRVVERHGGRVWAEGKPGMGATFRFALPRPGSAGDGGGGS